MWSDSCHKDRLLIQNIACFVTTPQGDVPADVLLQKSIADLHSLCISLICHNKKETALPGLLPGRLFLTIICQSSFTFNTSTKWKEVCDNPVGVQCSLLKFGHEGCSIWQPPNGDSFPLLLTSASFSRWDCRPSDESIDCHIRMTVSWPARFL